LFNGKDLSGWQPFLRDNGDPAKTWSVADGLLRCTGNPAGYVRTRVDYADYRLHVEWRWVDKPGNNGVLVHMSEPDKVWPRSIECQLYRENAGDFFVIEGTEFKEHKGKKGRRVLKRHDSTENPHGEWNCYDIVCRGNSIRCFVNGVLQNVATEANVSSGKICLQSEGAAIEYRNVYIEPLDAVVRLWNGEDFSGWKRFLPDPKADVDKTWSIKNGIIRCTGKPAGYMRTENEYRDYVLHVEWRWPKGGGNSGVLLHMSGADKVWPRSIECQLASSNAGDFWVIDGTEFDEHKDKASGRVKGRRTVKLKKPSEKRLGEWNAYDIVCKGNSIEVFVNGVLQNKATNTSVTGGRVCLQSEGKPIEFRNVYLRPLR